MKRTILRGLLLLGLLVLTGCAEGPGGAYQATTVTVLPADLSGDTAEVGGDVATTDSSGPTAATGGPGNFAGRVILSGSAPGLAPLVAQGADVKDKAVCAVERVPNEKLVLGADNGVANVFIYIQKAPKGTPKPTFSEEAFIKFDQKNCRFLPHCLIVPTGQTVKVLSGDAVAHNTHTYPQRNTGVSTVVPVNDREGKLEIVYKAAERQPIRVTCDFHTWMSAWHFPVDHPFVGLSDADGNFEINNLPAGDHVFAVWHEAVRDNFVNRKLKVSIHPGETTQQDIEFPASMLDL